MTGSAPSCPLVLVEERDGYAIVTLNRPEKRNAVNPELAAQLAQTLSGLDECPVIVITGAGTAFCAGIDLTGRGPQRPWRETLGASGGQYWAETIDLMRRHPAVFIAAVNGYALGGGVTLVNMAELAVAAEDAQFGMPELGFASYPALSGPTTMKRLLPKHAFEMALIPRRVDAHTAWRWGLVNEVVPAGELLERAGDLARTVAALDPVTVAYTKRALHEAGESTWVAGIEQGALIAGLVHATRRVRDTGTEEAR